jgi:ribose 5-phosphate isomerase A
MMTSPRWLVMLPVRMNPKQRVAEAALELIHDDMIVGLGSGSTSECFIRTLADAIRSGRFRNIRGVPTSRRSEELAAELGIPVVPLSDTSPPEVVIDGADEVAPNCDVIKGLGGALLREKIVAQNSRRLVIIADQSKTVTTLGTRSPLPVEVAIFAHETHVQFLRSLGAEPTLRRNSDGSPYVTDNSNYIYDCRFQQIAAPRMVELALKSRAGVLESGLFIGIADLALIGTDEGVKRISR